VGLLNSDLEVKVMEQLLLDIHQNLFSKDILLKITLDSVKASCLKKERIRKLKAEAAKQFIDDKMLDDIDWKFEQDIDKHVLEKLTIESLVEEIKKERKEKCAELNKKFEKVKKNQIAYEGIRRRLTAEKFENINKDEGSQIKLEELNEIANSLDETIKIITEVVKEAQDSCNAAVRKHYPDGNLPLLENLRVLFDQDIKSAISKLLEKIPEYKNIAPQIESDFVANARRKVENEYWEEKRKELGTLIETKKTEIANSNLDDPQKKYLQEHLEIFSEAYNEDSVTEEEKNNLYELLSKATLDQLENKIKKYIIGEIGSKQDHLDLDVKNETRHKNLEKLINQELDILNKGDLNEEKMKQKLVDLNLCFISKAFYSYLENGKRVVKIVKYFQPFIKEAKGKLENNEIHQKMYADITIFRNYMQDLTYNDIKEKIKTTEDLISGIEQLRKERAEQITKKVKEKKEEIDIKKLIIEMVKELILKDLGYYTQNLDNIGRLDNNSLKELEKKLEKLEKPLNKKIESLTYALNYAVSLFQQGIEDGSLGKSILDSEPYKKIMDTLVKNLKRSLNVQIDEILLAQIEKQLWNQAWKKVEKKKLEEEKSFLEKSFIRLPNEIRESKLEPEKKGILIEHLEIFKKQALKQAEIDGLKSFFEITQATLEELNERIKERLLKDLINEKNSIDIEILNETEKTACLKKIDDIVEELKNSNSYDLSVMKKMLLLHQKLTGKAAFTDYLKEEISKEKISNLKKALEDKIKDINEIVFDSEDHKNHLNNRMDEISKLLKLDPKDITIEKLIEEEEFLQKNKDELKTYAEGIN
jgi:hypothetical protein